jgi:hypothetical protein
LCTNRASVSENFREKVAPHLKELSHVIARFDGCYPAVEKLIVESVVSRRPSAVEIFGFSYLVAHEAARKIAQGFRHLEGLLDDPCAANRWSLQIIPLRGKDASYMASNFGRLDELIRQEYLWATAEWLETLADPGQGGGQGGERTASNPAPRGKRGRRIDTDLKKDERLYDWVYHNYGELAVDNAVALNSQAEPLGQGDGYEHVTSVKRGPCDGPWGATWS